MGLADIGVKEFMNDNRNFADAVNLALFHGERVVQPEKLQAMAAASKKLGRPEAALEIAQMALEIAK